ncbi:glutathione S-transferase theta-3-like [Gastrophryne carolinensis]
MAELTLYLDLMSQPCRSVFIFAKANNIPFHNYEVQLFKGEQHSEEFGRVNPRRKVPALKDGDFTMGESTAMLLYMANKYKTSDHWYPADIQKRARVDEYLAWQHTNTRPHGSKIFWAKAMAPFLLGHELECEKLDPLVADFNSTLKNLEETFIQGKPFIAGDEISIADLVAMVELMQPIAAGVNFFEDRPNLADWKQRVVEAIGAELFKEAHMKIMQVKEMQKMPMPEELKEKLKGVLRQIIR